MSGYNSAFFLFLAACEILVLWPGIEPIPSALEAQSLSHWATREVWGWLSFSWSWVYSIADAFFPPHLRKSFKLSTDLVRYTLVNKDAMFTFPQYWLPPEFRISQWVLLFSCWHNWRRWLYYQDFDWNGIAGGVWESLWNVSAKQS